VVERPVVLDVGCGDGRFLDAMARRGWRTLGSEIALPGARLASGRHPALVGELAAVSPRPLLDAITFWDVLEHLPDPSRTVREASRRLRGGGVVAASMPNLRGSASLAMGSKWPYYDFVHYGHLHHLSPRHLERLLRDAGMAAVYRETRGSVDLRDAPEAHGLAPPSRAATWVLDRLSGLVARIAEPLGFGNTIVVLGRKPIVGGSGP
jgi:SAM-dependent methyltransferase